ncbi:VOC family protein [Salipaludibacillus agaradhaerens]|uniref:VOC family protein n=1 Tax=Salipaludibacillus agaradhaerens TaxID=76935 RepID=UPI000997FD75|nr:VOC family protein [Salipaludibacillus agaradhaerens]
MKIEHVAVWVNDLENMKHFYTTYFNGQANDKYTNTRKQFESYFISFESGARLEIMRKQGVDNTPSDTMIGWAHIAFSTGSEEAVDELTERLKKDGYSVVNGPRVTGDGYYESVVEDPEGNLVELTL